MARGAKTALITGSGRNIGRGCAHYLARAGFNIVVNGSTQRDICDRTAGEVRDLGTDALVCMADLGDQAAVERMAAEALEEFGRVDVLLNNAAIRPLSPFLEMTDADLAHVMNVNTYSAVWLSRAFLPGMIENGWGRIINNAGTNSLRGTAGRPHVSMAKHASWGLTKALSREFGPMGVTTNIVSPGTFPDEDEATDASTRYEALRKQIPVGRLGQHEDIGATVGFLCSDKGGFINGQLIQVNGGVVG